MLDEALGRKPTLVGGKIQRGKSAGISRAMLGQSRVFEKEKTIKEDIKVNNMENIKL